MWVPHENETKSLIRLFQKKNFKGKDENEDKYER